MSQLPKTYEGDKTVSGARVLYEVIKLSKHRNIQKATIMTCHSAKGLEWPIVFVPQGKTSHNTATSADQAPLFVVVDGVFPHHRSRGEKEELEERYN
jgi:superfamily I DNA/RNA helicase